MPAGDFGFPGFPGMAPHFGQGPQNQPFERIERQADANRGIARNISPLLAPPLGLGDGATPIQGPWIQNVESTDYTLYCTRSWSGPEAPAALLREAQLRLTVGAGSALTSDELLLPQLSPIGFAYHISAQTLKATLLASPRVLGQLYFQNDSVTAWIARGRPFESINQTIVPADAVLHRIPSFARSVNVSEQFPATFTAATAILNWHDVDGTIISTTSLLTIAGASVDARVYALAAYYSVVDVNPLLYAVLQWKCIG